MSVHFCTGCPQCHESTGTHVPWCTRAQGAERKVECRDCGRQSGGVHLDSCPRSRRARRALDASLDAPPRTAYPSKGFFSVTVHGEVKGGFNPGVPLVRSPKPRTAGGMPTGTMRVPTKYAAGIPVEFAHVHRPEAAKIFLKDWGMVGREVKTTRVVGDAG